MKKILLLLTFAAIALITAVALFAPTDAPPSAMTALREKMKKKPSKKVDHSMFPALQGRFDRPQDVTETCISCHNHRHTEVMRSNHWNWEREEYVAGRGVVYIGKKNTMNNFCIGAMGNEKSCAKCHIGLGMTDDGFSYTDASNIDCLVCHDNTETYTKASEQGGAPVATLDFGHIARNVGKPMRSNCGVCHFYGGGGNNVKHGDLEEAMFQPTRDVDVHMGIDGMDMSCVDCHITEEHNMAGKLYSLSSMNRNRAYCETCHGETPHESGVLNEHTLKVACQTCHIPVYAKVNATKTHWDWSTVGKLKDGEPYEVDDEEGNHTYLSIKGTFTWGKKLQPEYVWFNGTASHYLLGDQYEDSTATISLNRLHGSYSDSDAKIIPVKVHRAIQPTDPVNRMLIMPKLYSDKEGEGALWMDFDWQRSAALGMEKAGLPFSGKVSFIKTEMYWPINHMVSGKEATVQCTECHTRDNGRLAGLTDFYMPGRDYSPLVESAGVALLLVTLLGMVAHGSIRVIAAKRKNNGGTR
jgi:octaheme c-type cytochrome (tetrathionate reductase family)